MVGVDIDGYLSRVERSFRTGVGSPPFADPTLTQTEAYRVQYRLIERLRISGEVVVGHKVALTTKASREHLGVNEPCFGHILDRCVYPNDSQIPIANLADPHIEAETAFVLAHDIKGPGVTPIQVMQSTHAVLPALELVDLKIEGSGIQAADVIAHNALHGGVVVGSRMEQFAELELQYEGVTVEFNGNLHGSGTGFEVMGNPINPIVWLANKLAEFDDFLRAGEMIISGAMVVPVRLKPGDFVKVTYSHMGTIEASFI